MGHLAPAFSPEVVSPGYNAPFPGEPRLDVRGHLDYVIASVIYMKTLLTMSKSCRPPSPGKNPQTIEGACVLSGASL